MKCRSLVRSGGSKKIQKINIFSLPLSLSLFLSPSLPLSLSLSLSPSLSFSLSLSPYSFLPPSLSFSFSLFLLIYVTMSITLIFWLWSSYKPISRMLPAKSSRSER